MKREKDIYIKIIDEANILAAIEEVNSTHRWNQGHKPNRTVLWIVILRRCEGGCFVKILSECSKTS